MRPFFFPLRNFLIRISLFLVLIACISCDSKRIFEENKEFTDGIWNYKNVVEFNVDIQDTVSLCNLFLNIRHRGDYPFSNLYLFVTTVYPDGKQSRDTLGVPLANDEGRWYGKSSGSLFFRPVLFMRKFAFRRKGIHRFEMEQAMRMDDLPGMADVGIRIEKTE